MNESHFLFPTLKFYFTRQVAFGNSCCEEKFSCSNEMNCVTEKRQVEILQHDKQFCKFLKLDLKVLKLNLLIGFFLISFNECVHKEANKLSLIL